MIAPSLQRWLAASLLLPLIAATTGALHAQAKPGRTPEEKEKDKAAYEQELKEGTKRFNAACKTAGRSVRSSIKGVPGIRLEVPPGALSFEGPLDPNWAFAGMPMERMGEKYIASFLDFKFGDMDLHSDFGGRTGTSVTMMGFQAVDVLQKDGAYLRYRLKTKSPYDGMVSEPVSRDQAFRHVVAIEPLGSAEDRKHWVGGTRIRVTDSQNGQLMGELRTMAFAYPPRDVKADQLFMRTWNQSTWCPKYLDIQSAMTRTSLIGIVDPASPQRQSALTASAAGLEDAVAKGVLRKATWQDVDDWRAAITGAPKPKTVRAGEPYGSYVVLAPFALPPGMYGAHSAEFYVPKGKPPPTGELGHSTIFDFNSMTCQGVTCR